MVRSEDIRPGEQPNENALKWEPTEQCGWSRMNEGM